MSFNRKAFIFITALAVAVFVAAGCFGQSKTDLTPQEADKASQEIAQSAQSSMSDAQYVYLYAFPYMAEEFGEEVFDYDAETYFVKFGNLVSEKDITVSDEAGEKMVNMGYYGDHVFSIDGYSADMCTEVESIKRDTDQKIKEGYSGETDGELWENACAAYDNLNK